MNQFSDLLVIEASIVVQITLAPVLRNDAPYVRTICHDRTLFQGQLLQEQTWAITVDLLDPIDLSIELSGKKYSAESETAVVIKSVMIDGFDIVPAWTHLATYQNDKNNIDPTSYLGFNGTWRLHIAVRDCIPSSSNTIDG